MSKRGKIIFYVFFIILDIIFISVIIHGCSTKTNEIAKYNFAAVYNLIQEGDDIVNIETYENGSYCLTIVNRYNNEKFWIFYNSEDKTSHILLK